MSLWECVAKNIIIVVCTILFNYSHAVPGHQQTINISLAFTLHIALAYLSGLLKAYY